jgi:hypothetical protein
MNDEDLKQRFRELRARDAKNAPSFDALTAQRPRRVSPLVLLAPTLAAAAMLIVWCGAARTASAPSPVAFDSPPPPPAAAPSPAPAALPLDFLLETTPIHVSLDSDPTEGLVP